MTDLARLTAALADRYAVERQLGSGGMAKVYLAEDLRHDRKVAIKVLRPELASVIGPERFAREIKITAKLQHTNVLPLLDSGEADGLLYYVMPLIEGESLRDRLDRETQLPFEDVLAITDQVASALQYAHDHDIVHRDIKPENIMLSGEQVIVADFGIARAISSVGDQKLTETGLAIGTASYMSPEQATGTGEVDGRTDQYALGCMVYEMLAGQPPFIGPNVQSVVSLHLTAEPTSVTHMRPATPPGAAAAITRALSKTPVDRFKTTAEFAKALRAEGPVIVTPTAWKRWATIAATVAVVLVGGIVVGRNVSGGGPSVDPANDTGRIVVIPFDNRSGDPSLDEAGYMAAEWVTQGLQREAIGQPVPAASVSRMLSALGEEIVDPVSVLVDETRAEIAIYGSILRDGDQIILTSQAIDVQTGDVIGVTEEVRAVGLSEAVSIATQRIQGLLAVHFNYGKSSFAMSPPPSMEVYHELVRGREALYRGDFAEAATRFDRISTLAPDYRSHVIGAAAVRFWTGDYAVADSALRWALASPGRLTSSERLGLEYMFAMVQGDLEEEYRTAVARVTEDPTQAYNQALAAIRTNRPREALAVFETVDLDSPFAQLYAGLWAIPSGAYHALGDYRENLVAAQEARARYPTDLGVLNLAITAAAALGDAELLDGLLSEALGMTGPLEIPPADTPGWSRVLAGLELAAHGHAELSAEWLARASEWYRDQGARLADDEEMAYASAIANYYGGNLDGAASAFQALNDADPGNIDYLGFFGVLSARRGDAAGASAIANQLAGLDGAYKFGQHTRWRARIAALSGDSGHSMELLRQAFSEGISLAFGQDWAWLHIDPDLQSLRGLEAFEAFRAPRAGARSP